MMLIMPIFRNTAICLETGGNLNQIAKRINETRSIYQICHIEQKNAGHTLRRGRSCAMIHTTQCVEDDGYGSSEKDNGTS